LVQDAVRLDLCLIGVLGLTGCAFTDPRIEGSLPPVEIDHIFFAQVQEAAEEVHQAWALVSALEASQADGEHWAELAGTLKAQWLVLVGPDPLNRFEAIGADSGPPAEIDDHLLSSADSALSLARDQNLIRAEESTGIQAAFWASLACGIEQVRRGVGNPYTSPRPANPASTLMILTEPEALESLVLRYHEAVFALEAALGFLAAADPARSTFFTMVSVVRKNLAALTALVDSPVPFPGIYELPEGRDRQAAFDLAATVQRSLVQASAVWVASAPDPGVAIDYMIRGAILTSDLGIGLAHWPGWPD
jgi:hypothetical protein